MQQLNHNEKHQLESIKQFLQRTFQDKLYAIYLYGSYINGGLKRKSDLDILVIIERAITASERQQIAKVLLQISVPVGHASARALEITILNKETITTKKPPYSYQLQYGEWLRDDLLHGTLLTAQSDPDISILLRQAQLHHITILGPNLNQWLPPISDEQIKNAIQQSYPQIIAHWKDDRDELNQILALCRMAYTLNKKTIVAKDVAARWFLQYLNHEDQTILQLIIDEYKGEGNEQNWPDRHLELSKIVDVLQQNIEPHILDYPTNL